MSRTTRLLIVVIVAVASVGGYWKFVLAPKRVEANDLSAKILSTQAQLAQQQALVKTYQDAKGAYQTNYASVVRLGKAVPADDDTRSLVVQLDTAAKRSGIDFDVVDIGAAAANPASASGAGSAAQANVTPGAVNLGSFSAIPFNLAFTGTYSTLENFFARLERFVTVSGDDVLVNGRMLKVDAISLKPAENGWPGLDADVAASAFIVPRSSDAAAGSNVSAPATTTTTTTSTTAAGSDLR